MVQVERDTAAAADFDIAGQQGYMQCAGSNVGASGLHIPAVADEVARPAGPKLGVADGVEHRSSGLEGRRFGQYDVPVGFYLDGPVIPLFASEPGTLYQGRCRHGPVAHGITGSGAQAVTRRETKVQLSKSA